MVNPVDILIRILGGDAAAAGVGKVEGAMGGLAKGALAVVAAAGAAAAALAAMTYKAIEHADQMGKNAQKVGVLVENLTALSYAADLADASSGDLQMGLKTLSQIVVNADQGQKEALKTFRDLDLAWKNGNGTLRSVDDILLDVAERFERMPDGIRKTDLAVQLFGRSGQDLIPLLNSGRGGIEELMAKARQLGLVVGPEFSRNANEFNDLLTEAKQTIFGAALQLADKLLPALLGVTRWLVDFLQKDVPFRQFIDYAVMSFSLLAKGALTVAYGFQQIGAFIGTFSGNLSTTWSPLKAWTAATEVLKTNTKEYEAALNRISGINPPEQPKQAPINNTANPSLAAGGPRLEPLELALQRLRNAQDALNRSGLPQIEQRRTLLALYQAESSGLDKLQKQAQFGADLALKASMSEALSAEDRNQAWDEYLRKAKEALDLDQQRNAVMQKQRTLWENSTFLGGMTAGFRDLSGQMATFGRSVADSFFGVFEAGIQTVSEGLTGLFVGTMKWADFLARIPTQILTSIIGAVIQLGVRWVATQILMATVGKAVLAASVAATAPLAAAQSAIWATPATLSTIASYGTAAAAAPGFIAAAQGVVLAQSVLGLADGGLVRGPGTGTSDSIPAMLSDGEFVIPAERVAALGVPFFEGIRSGEIQSPSESVGTSSGAASPAPQTNQTFLLSLDPARLAQLQREHIEAIVIDLLGKHLA